MGRMGRIGMEGSTRKCAWRNSFRENSINAQMSVMYRKGKISDEIGGKVGDKSRKQRPAIVSINASIK